MALHNFDSHSSILITNEKKMAGEPFSVSSNIIDLETAIQAKLNGIVLEASKNKGSTSSNIRSYNYKLDNTSTANRVEPVSIMLQTNNDTGRYLQSRNLEKYGKKYRVKVRLKYKGRISPDKVDINDVFLD